MIKLWLTGVYIIIFLISAQKHRLWVLVWTASPRRFWRIPTIYALSRIWKISEFLSENFLFLVVKFSRCLNRRVFVLGTFFFVAAQLSLITEQTSKNARSKRANKTSLARQLFCQNWNETLPIYIVHCGDYVFSLKWVNVLYNRLVHIYLLVQHY